MMTSRIKLLYRCELQSATHKVWLWHARRYSVDCLTPVNPRLHIEKRPINLGKGSKLHFRIDLIKKLAIRLCFEHEGCVVGRQFTDVMTKGPCHLWRHEHRFLPWKATTTILEDHLEVELSRFGWINRYLHPFLEKKLDRLFKWRHHVTSLNIRLWEQLPFADRVHVIGISPKTHWLTKRLRHQLEPIPVHDHDPLQLTLQHGLQATVFNAIGYTKSFLGQKILEELRRHHAGILICFYDQTKPAWIETLQAYADQLVLIQTHGFLNPHQWCFSSSKQEKWCSEEDLLSIVFQVLHERAGYGNWHFRRCEPLPNGLMTFFRKYHEELEKKKKRGVLQQLLFQATTFLKSQIDPRPSSALFPLKMSPWKSFKDWKEISYRV